eukprot:1641655-Lingulodinium_polyedra.AAC.1
MGAQVRESHRGANAAVGKSGFRPSQHVEEVPDVVTVTVDGLARCHEDVNQGAGRRQRDQTQALLDLLASRALVGPVARDTSQEGTPYPDLEGVDGPPVNDHAPQRRVLLGHPKQLCREGKTVICPHLMQRQEGDEPDVPKAPQQGQPVAVRHARERTRQGGGHLAVESVKGAFLGHEACKHRVVQGTAQISHRARAGQAGIVRIKGKRRGERGGGVEVRA